MKQKNLVPKGNLYEIKFEDFDQGNLVYLKYIYEKLNLDTWNNAEPYFKKYIQAQNHYKKKYLQNHQTGVRSTSERMGFCYEKI